MNWLDLKTNSLVHKDSVTQEIEILEKARIKTPMKDLLLKCSGNMRLWQEAHFSSDSKHLERYVTDNWTLTERTNLTFVLNRDCSVQVY